MVHMNTYVYSLKKVLSQNMLTSHVNCLEETGHHVEAHVMLHMLLFDDCGIGQIEQIRHKSKIM